MFAPQKRSAGAGKRILTIFLRITKRRLERRDEVNVRLQIRLTVRQLFVQRLYHRVLLFDVFRLLSYLRSELLGRRERVS